MTKFLKAWPVTALGAVAALAVAAPAVAQARSDIGTNDIIAGALILGGIAAVSGAFGGDDDHNRYDRASGYRYDNDQRRYDDRARNDRYGGNANPRRAVEQCVRAAERNASRYGRADVTDVRDVKRTRDGFEVKGRIAVSPNGRNWRDGDRGGYDRSMRGSDSGNFKCRVERDRLVALDYSGIRGL